MAAPLETSALCTGADPESRAALQREGAAVYAAFVIFGLGSWSSINAVFVESSFLVSLQPERWALTTWIVLALQAANLAVLFAVQPLLQKLRLSWTVASAASLLLAIGSCLGLSLRGYRYVAVLFGAERSAGLLALTFLGGLANCGSSLVFYPLAATFPRRFTTALAVGEGLSGSVAGVLGLVQNHFQKAGALAFSPTTYFGIEAGVSIAAASALLFIDRHRFAEKLRECQERRPSFVPVVSEEACSGAAAAPAGQSLVSTFWSFRTPLLALFLGAAFSFGVLPSVNPIACLHYSDGQLVLLWSNVVIYGFDPVSRLMTAFTNFRRLGALIVVFVLAAAVVLAAAKVKPSEATPGLFGWPWVVPLANVVFAASFGYARTMAFLILKDASRESASAEYRYWAAGFAVQSGSFAGSVVALLLVEVFKAL